MWQKTQLFCHVYINWILSPMLSYIYISTTDQKQKNTAMILECSIIQLTQTLNLSVKL